MCGRSKQRLKLQYLFLAILAIYIVILGYISSDVLSSSHNVSDINIQRLPSQEGHLSRNNQLLAQPPMPRSNIIVNSYMRGGSSFVGRLLGYHPDAFYIYEPLWKYDIWNFYKRSSLQCNSKDCSCWHNKAAASMIHKVQAMVSCNGFKDVVVAKMTAFYSGVPWTNFTACIFKNPIRRLKISNSDPIPTHCLQEMQMECQKYKHTVAKILRLTVDMYQELLNNTKDTKVVHVFRDPRAVLNSRLKTKWYPITSLSDVTPNAKCLCERMLIDYEAGLKLQWSYPKRFRFVFYEDLFEDLVLKTNRLYEFGGIRSVDSIGTESFQRMVDFGLKSDHSLRDNSTDYASWWRHSLDWAAVKSIDSVCQKVYSALGYKKFDTEASLRDKNVSSFIFPSKYQL